MLSYNIAFILKYAAVSITCCVSCVSCNLQIRLHETYEGQQDSYRLSHSSSARDMNNKQEADYSNFMLAGTSQGQSWKSWLPLTNAGSWAHGSHVTGIGLGYKFLFCASQWSSRAFMVARMWLYWVFVTLRRLPVFHNCKCVSVCSCVRESESLALLKATLISLMRGNIQMLMNRTERLDSILCFCGRVLARFLQPKFIYLDWIETYWLWLIVLCFKSQLKEK